MEVKRSEELLKIESLREDSFSSHAHAIETIAVEASGYGKVSEFSIPDRYFINTLVILPANTNTQFLYWEINDSYIRSVYKGEYFKFTIKMYEKNGFDEIELLSFDVFGNIGKQYINFYSPNKTIYAILGITDDFGNFIPLLRSNVISSPSDVISSGEEIWMSKMADWVEIIHASLEKINIGLSSAAMIREYETELLKRHQRMKIELDVTKHPFSSHSILGEVEFLGSSNFSSFNLSSTSLVR